MITASESKQRNKNWGNPNPQLFDDTSSAPPAGYDIQQQGFVPQSGTCMYVYKLYLMTVKTWLQSNLPQCRLVRCLWINIVVSTLYLEDGQF